MAQDLETAVRNAVNGCSRHLAHFNDETMSFDGCHSGIKGVVVAEQLIKSMGLCKHLTEFKMVTIIVEDVPAMDVRQDIDWETVELLSNVMKTW
jgi:hypothetical protein